MQGQMPGYKRSYEDPFYSGPTNGGHSPLSSGSDVINRNFQILYGYSGSSSSMPSGKNNRSDKRGEKWIKFELEPRNDIL